MLQIKLFQGVGDQTAEAINKFFEEYGGNIKYIDHQLLFVPGDPTIVISLIYEDQTFISDIPVTCSPTGKH